MVCSICGGNHKRNNKKYHTKEEIVIHDMLMDIIKTVEKENKGENKKSNCKGNCKSNCKRKNTDYQFTELLISLILLGLELIDDISYEYITQFSNKKFNEEKLLCKKETLEKYFEDLKYSFDKKTFTTSYISNFKKEILHINLSDIKYVYLTGKSYKDFSDLINLNKDYEYKKPNSDVYFKLNNDEIHGISCKQNSNSPLTNKIAEKFGLSFELSSLQLLRANLLKENGITKDNCRVNLGRHGKLSNILCNQKCFTNELQEYWKSLQEHIINYKNPFIQGVLDSISQGTYLPYYVYEYDGLELIDTKDRILEKELCDIRVSNTFCYGKKGPRKASKIWFDFLYQGEIKYNLEVRFKGEYFGEKGKPQIFVLKESKEDIAAYQKIRDKYVNNP